MAALQWALANVTNPPTVFVTGGSAGSVASYMWAPHIFKLFPNARHVHLGDSYAPLFGKKGYNSGFTNWKARTLYYQSGIPGLDVRSIINVKVRAMHSHLVISLIKDRRLA